MQDLVAGRIDYLCDIVSTALPQIRGNTVKPIALMAKTRSPVLPDLPTALEQGVADVDADGWNGFFFPKGTPDAIVRRLAAATDEALNTPAVKKRIEELGLTFRRPTSAAPTTSILCETRTGQVGPTDQGGRHYVELTRLGPKRGVSARSGGVSPPPLS